MHFIKINMHFISGLLCTSHVTTTNQVGNIFTEGQQSKAFCYLTSKLK